MTYKLTLRPTQQAALDRILNEPTKAFMLAAAPGWGKTAVVSQLIADLWLDYGLIVGVVGTYKQWADRLSAQSDGTLTLRKIDSSVPGQKAMADYLSGIKGFYFVGLQYAASKDHQLVPQFNSDGSPKLDKDGKQIKKRTRLKTWEKVRPDIVIYDEGHVTSKRHNNGTNTMLSMDAEWKGYVSGTPYNNQFENMHSPSMWLWPERTERSFAMWRQKWCRTATQYVPGGRAVQKTIGEKNPGDYVKTLPCYIYGEAPVLAAGDSKIPAPEVLEVDMTPEQMRVYLELEEELLAWVNDHPLSVDWPVTLQGYLRLVALAEPSVDPETGKIRFEEGCASAKFDETVSLLNGKWQGENVLILTHSQRWAERLTQLLNSAGFEAAEYSGKTSNKARDEVKGRFSRGELRVLVASTQATKLGLDGLQQNCCKVLEHSIVVGDPSGQDQGIRRIWRPGNPRIEEFEYVRLAARGTIETGLYARQDLAMAEQRRTLKLRGAA